MARPDRPDPERIALDFLSQCLRGRPSMEDVQRICREGRENFHLEFKAADWTKAADKSTEPDRFDRRVRAWIAGFANVGGGTLIIGAKEVKREGTGDVLYCELDPVREAWDGKQSGWGKHRAEELLKNYIRDLGPNVRVMWHVLEGDFEGLVIVLAVERAETLIHCVEDNGRWVNYFRVGDGTYAAPSYLVEDMVLGKHRRSVLELLPSFTPAYLRVHDEYEAPIEFTVRNESLVHLQAPAAGLVFYNKKLDSTNAGDALLASIIDGKSVAGGCIEHRKLGPSAPDLLDPFREMTFRTGPGFRLPFHPRGTAMLAAVYITGLNQPPTWFQVLAKFLPQESEFSILLFSGD